MTDMTSLISFVLFYFIIEFLSTFAVMINICEIELDSLRSGFINQISTGEHSGVDSAGILGQGVYMKNSKPFISTYTTPATTEPSTLVTQVEGLPLIKSHVSLIMWSCESTWKKGKVTSSLSQELWAFHLAQWWLKLRACHFPSHVSLWLCGHMIPRYKIKTYLRLYKTRKPQI